MRITKPPIFNVLKEKSKKVKNQKMSNQTRTEIAVEMVILDAIGKGHTNGQELMEYMRSEVFTNAVQSYLAITNELFN